MQWELCEDAEKIEMYVVSETYILKPQIVASLDPSCKRVETLRLWKRPRVCYQFVISHGCIMKKRLYSN
jgi:hypothetical protein